MRIEGYSGVERVGRPMGALRRFSGAFLAVVLLLGAFAVPSFAQNAIVTENQLAGNPASEWDISGAGDLSIQGFGTDISVNKGETARFKINTSAAAYTIRIYRLGYYGGNGARFVGNGVVTATLPQGQPSPLLDAATGLVDCGNWAESAHWDVPATAVSGIYIARLTRTDTQGSSHICFIVRDDASLSKIICQTSDATWQAYNVYGGNSLYVGTAPFPGGHAAKVSYNRPFITRNGGGGSGEAAQDWVFNAEYPMVRWLEANGYDVTYTTNVDGDRRGTLIQQHKLFLSVGHDEYWSAGLRANVEAARNAGVHIAFFSGNEIYWKTRFEPSISAGATDYRTLVCYKEGTLGENVCGTKCDPLSTSWTGLWRDGCASTPPADGCKPENALTGQISWVGTQGAMTLTSAYKSLRFWRNTAVASLGSGQSITTPAGTLGYEWDQQQYDAYYPSGRILLSTTSFSGQTHHLSLYRAPSGALVFGAGTVQWSWGLDSHHDRGSAAPTTVMQQATVNLFADMGVQPATLQPGLVAASASTDLTPPTTTITSPVNGASITTGSAITITGTASDVGGQLIGVEVSVDGGATWQPASGTTNWTYSWVPSINGSAVIKSRGYDDSGNMQPAGTPPAANAITVNVTVTANCPCSAFLPTDAPALPAVTDNTQIETGVKFRSAVNGYVTGARFYKGSTNTGTHLGHVWSTSGTMLAEATYTNETASGWQEVAFGTPVQVTANTTYVVSVHSTGYYADTTPYFTAAVVRGPLRLLADGEDGPNGVYDYGVSKLPVSTFQKSNYWVDLVFNTTVGTDVTPPTVLATTPAANAVAVPAVTTVTATFNESIDPATVTTSSVLLRTPSLTTVPATVTYDAPSRTATLTPSAALAYSTTYSVVLKGGTATPHITDLANNALVSDVTWSFTTTAPPPPPPNEGPGGPILVLSAASNPFSRYPVEILRAEGFNLFAAKDIATATVDTLAAFDVIVLGDMSLTGGQVTLLTNWVNAGGTLVALHPSKLLAGLLGLTDAASTLSNKYLRVTTGSGPGAGIVGETMQFHGPADLYTLNGATAIATLYSGVNTSTIYPAVTTRTVGANGGQAIAFTYDLARSVVYTRQGNPAWAGQERDGTAPIRSDDLFFGASASDPQPDWVDLTKVAIPQADEQQRLLANLMLQGNLHRKPLPRFWYFPKGKKAVVIMTGDDHGDAGMQPRFDIYRQESPSGCSLDDWECVRATGYEYVGSGFTDAQAAFYNNLGFETALHVNTNCANWTPASLEPFFASQLATFGSAFPSIPAPTTNRTHCIAFSDWSTEPETEIRHNIRFDTNYYYWPPTWVNDRPGMFTGSGMPMRFAKTDGTILDCYQAATQMTDESGQTYPMTGDSLLARAWDVRGYYGAFCANLHFDTANHPSSNALVASALATGTPVVSAKQMLTWLDGRNGSAFGGVSWSGNALSFSISVATGARNLQAMLPMMAATARLTSLTRNGGAVVYTTQTIKGMEYAFFSADPGNYSAGYVADTTPPAITAVLAAPGGSGTSKITWTTNEVSTSRVDYGTNSASLTLNASDPTQVLSHSITLSGLGASTTYYYRVTSADASANSSTSPNPPASPLSFAMPGNTPPVAGAVGLPLSGTTPLLVNFSGATSTDADGDSLTFNWVFGDGGTAAGRLATHTFTTAGTYTTTLTVNDGRGGSASANLSITATPPASFPSTAVLDNFNRANGAIGGSWVDQTSAFTINANTLAPPAGDANIEWNGAVFGSNQEVFVTLSTLSAAVPEHNLMLKTQGTTWAAGHIEVSYDAPHSKVVVYTFTPPSNWQLVGTISGVTFAAGNQFGARALADGTVQVYKNGLPVGAVSVVGWPYAALGGRIGLSSANAAASRFDNFGGGNVAAAGNTAPVASVATPANNSFYYTGQTIALSGSAIDAQTRSDSLTYGWVVDLIFGSHLQPAFATYSGTTASHAGADLDDGTGVHQLIKFTAKDPQGLVSDTVRVAIWPEIDLVPSAVTVTPTTPTAGQSAHFVFALSDSGRMPAQTSHWVLRAGTTVLAQGDAAVAANGVTNLVADVAIPTSGTFALRLTADSLGTVFETKETNNATVRALTVNPLAGNTPPVAVAVGLPLTGPAPLSVNFSGATSTDANGDSLTFSWAFGDGGTATGRLASHIFASAGNYTTVLTVNDGKGGTSTANVAITATSAGFPQTAVLDNFNRANGAVAGSWVDQTTAFTINANTLAPPAGDAYVEWNGTVFGANQEVFVTLSTIAPSGQEHNLMLKTQGTTWSAGHIEVSYYAAGANVSVYVFVPPSTWKTAGTINGLSFAAGNQFGARALSDGRVGVYKNGVLAGTVTVTDFAALGGRIGLSSGNAGASRFDDFGGGNVTGTLAMTTPETMVEASSAPSVSPPTVLSLSGAYPNPTTGSVQLALALPNETDVSMTVLDIQGRQVWSVPTQHFGAGHWSLKWDGRSSSGQASVGLYLARIRVGKDTYLRRIAIIR